MQNITQRDTVVPLHGGSYFVRPLDTDPRTFNGDRDAAWRMDASDAFAETLQRHEYQPHRLTFGERLVLLFRFHAFAIGVALYVLAVSVACYFAFELGRAVLS